MRALFTGENLIVLAFLCLVACQSKPACRDISGAWSDREGHDFEFHNDGKALWLNRFGQMVDTVRFAFVLHCETQPASIDLTGFSSGPFSGKTLYGIIEWSADSLFRLCYEIGQQPDCRPKQFDPEQTLKFYR